MNTQPNPRSASNKPDSRGAMSDESENRDPISGTPGAHPVGTGVGAMAGGAAGLGIGAAVGGPVGAVIGAAAGAIAGGLGGKHVAEEFDPTVEEGYWRDNYRSRSYVGPDEPFDLYLPAYRFGWQQRAQARERGVESFDETERELAAAWERENPQTPLAWTKARLAVRDAWSRPSIERAENEGMPSRRAPEGTSSTQPRRDDSATENKRGSS